MNFLVCSNQRFNQWGDQCKDFDHICLCFFFSGRAASRLSLDLLKTTGIVKDGDVHLPYNSAHTVTVPGAASAWCDTVEKFGSGKVQHVITMLCLV